MAALADAAIYSMALEHGATLWTQDVAYQGLPGLVTAPSIEVALFVD